MVLPVVMGVPIELPSLHLYSSFSNTSKGVVSPVPFLVLHWAMNVSGIAVTFAQQVCSGHWYCHSLRVYRAASGWNGPSIYAICGSIEH